MVPGHVVQLTEPAETPVSVAELRKDRRITGTHHDELLASLILGATTYAEGFTRRVLVKRTFRLTLDDGFPRWSIVVPRVPLVSVESLKHLDGDGVEQTIAVPGYRVLVDREPGIIVPAFGTSWPGTRATEGAVSVEFTAGYASAAAVPAEIRRGILMLAGHWFENPEDVVVGTIAAKVPRAVDACFWLKRVFPLKEV